jgi:hypothetical protein
MAHHESAGRVYGQVWNQTDQWLLSKPGPLVGYPDPSVSLATANNGLLAGAGPAPDTANTDNLLEMKKDAEERKLHRMAKVYDILEML